MNKVERIRIKTYKYFFTEIPMNIQDSKTDEFVPNQVAETR